jgi:RNA polymerase sigma-70 factor (ECF subfamily)
MATVSDQPVTRPSLLLRVRDPQDAEAWGEFVGLYGPLVYRFARNRGLQDADAADLTQAVFQAVAGQVRRLDYDPERGTFRGWLFAVVRNQLGTYLRGLGRAPRGSGDTGVQDLLEELPGRETDDQAAWDAEYARRLFGWAADRVRGSFRDSTWRAFWETAVEGRGAQDVADELGTTVGAVYTAKSRVLDAIRAEVRQLPGGDEGVFGTDHDADSSVP